MAKLIEGTFTGKLVKGTATIGAKGTKVVARAELEVTEGEHKGRRFKYEGSTDEKGIKYTKRDLIALGWKGKASATVTADCDAALEGGLVVEFEVQIASWTNPDTGKYSEWNAVRSIGGFAQKPLDKLDAQKTANVDKWFAEAGDVGANGATGGNSDIPF